MGRHSDELDLPVPVSDDGLGGVAVTVADDEDALPDDDGHVLCWKQERKIERRGETIERIRGMRARAERNEVYLIRSPGPDPSV